MPVEHTAGAHKRQLSAQPVLPRISSSTNTWPASSTECLLRPLPAPATALNPWHLSDSILQSFWVLLHVCVLPGSRN